MSSRSTPAKFAALLLGAFACVAQAGPAPAVQTTADQLVMEAIASNLEGQMYYATVEQRIAALDIARARYLPTLDLQLRYSRADGGREIELPIGDLMNPVYATLNQLLAAQGQPAPFTSIENQSFPLLRPREQESKLTLFQPIYDARISAGASAASNELRAAEDGFEAFRVRLARDVRQAWYRWLGARQQIVILDATVDAASANLRVNESLYRNGKITRDLVYRAEADLLEIEQRRRIAGNLERQAQAYVNLLRNAKLDTPLPAVTIAPDDVTVLGADLARRLTLGRLELAALQAAAAESRAELRQLDAAIAAAGDGERVARAAFKPQLALVVDAGSQGEDFSYGSEDQYVLASAVLRFNLSRGGADRAALREARAVGDGLRAQRAYAAEQINLEVLQSLQNFEVATDSLAAAAKRVEAAEGAFRIATRKRDLGQLSAAEFIDARRALTDAHQGQNLLRVEAFSSLAALEYAVGQRPRVAVESSP